MSREIKDAAKEYLKAHLSVIPTKEDKLPALSTWKPYQSQRIKEEEVEALFSGANVKGLAIICGAISGGLEVIDVDTKHDTTGSLWAELKSLIEDNLPELYNRLVIAKTRSGGYHIYYRCSSIAGNLKLSTKLNREVLIETRGEGGYVIAPPTLNYTYIQGEPSNIPTITPENRDVLFSIAKSFNELEEIKPKVSTTSSTTYSSTGITPFEDYNQRGDLVALLESKGWKVVSQRGQRINLLRPGQTDSKTSGNFHTGLNTLRVFSSSTEFNPDKAYSPAQGFTLLECNGDKELAYRRLLEQGYGEPYKVEDTRPTQVKTERIKVEAVNKVNKETSVISNPGENLKIENIQTALGEEVVITSPGLEAQEEVLKAIALIQQTSKRIYIKEGDTEVREYRYQLQTIINKYGTIQEESGELTDRDMDSFLDEVVILSSKLNPIDRDIFKTEFLGQEAIRELGISEESLSITVDRLTSTRDKEAQAKDLKKLLSEATQLHDKGEVNKALELLDNTVKDVKLKDKKSSFNKLLEIPTEEDIKLHFSQHSESLRSGFYVNNEELLLPSGGLTGIAGATGHGKTDFLINLTLNAVLNYPDKEFYFFTYEMSQEAILVRFLNTYLDIDLESYSNQRAIKTYFKTGSTQYIKTEAKDIFTAKVKEFFKDIIGSGRLRVKGIDYTAPELNLALSELSKKANIGGFFIDYFQLLNIPKEGYKNYSRQEELKVICQDLNNTAKQLQLPIILGAQFNREVTTPFKLHPTNISEAGDIERILDTLIGIWFTNKKIVAKDLTKAEENDFKNKGLDTPDKLYTYVLKSRETPTDVYELLDYNGKRGKIKNSNSSGSSYFQ
jgi:replicative DNA helicase